MSKKIINLTPHDCHLVLPNGKSIMYPKSGRVASVRQNFLPSELDLGEELKDVRVSVQEMDYTRGLPKPEEGVFYIVSLLVLDMEPNRHDLISPAGAIRDATGYITGFTGFYANI